MNVMQPINRGLREQLVENFQLLNIRIERMADKQECLVSTRRRKQNKDRCVDDKMEKGCYLASQTPADYCLSPANCIYCQRVRVLELLRSGRRRSLLYFPSPFRAC